VSKLKLPVILSSIIVLPLMALEIINRRSFNEGFPFVLFGTLWILPIPFFAILLPIVKDIRARKNIFAKPGPIIFKVAFMVFLAFIWGSIFLDQLPCFLGVPNCD